MKPDEVYLQRLRSGPIEEFAKTVEEITDLTDPHGQAVNFVDDDEEVRPVDAESMPLAEMPVGYASQLYTRSIKKS